MYIFVAQNTAGCCWGPGMPFSVDGAPLSYYAEEMNIDTLQLYAFASSRVFQRASKALNLSLRKVMKLLLHLFLMLSINISIIG